MQEHVFKRIAQISQTVFSFKELVLFLQATNSDNLKSKLSYYIKQNDLYHIRRGLYAKNANYNRLELAVKIFTPAYVSFETVLVKAGVVFQYYSQIFVASYQSREIVCDNHSYVFRKLKPIILTNSLGIIVQDNYSIATVERAFLDIVYHTKNYHFDNLEPINWDKVYEILLVYGNNKSLRKRVDRYYKSTKRN